MTKHKNSQTFVRAAGWVSIATLAFAAGCANMDDTQRKTAGGAAIGALGGAILSSATGGKAGTGAVVGGVAGAIAGNVWSKRMEKQKQAMEQATQGTGVDVSRTADNQLKLNIPSDISFDTGSSAIKPELRNVLTQFAQGLKEAPESRVRVIGHTDSTGSDAVNQPLSRDRASSVRNFLADRGVSSSRIETEGRGAQEPVASNDTTAGRAQNRRVEIYLREPGQG
ncbi:MAG: OmpA family protein [Rubrivivax sp.]|nr:MAG: OmpA family protein [Rubrivivax sp.]